MKEKKGFTLVELLVALACTTLVIAMVTGTFIFVNKSNDKIIEKANLYYQVQTVQKYVRSLNLTEGKIEPAFKRENGNIIHNEKLIAADSDITSIIAYTKAGLPDERPTWLDDESYNKLRDEFIYCRITCNYDDASAYTFIAGKVEVTPSE